MIKSFLQTLIIITLTAFPASAAKQPNIIYIMLDEWGYFEWSGMGHPILETPNIDQLAAEGIRFTHMLAGANVCGPTRSVLMTGQHCGHTPVRSNGGGTPLAAGETTIATVLKKAGYATGGFGKWGLGDTGTTGVPEKHGFDTFYGYYHQVHAHSYYPEHLVRNSKKEPLKGNTGDPFKGETFSHTLIHQAGLDFIQEHGSQKKPFFAYLPWTPPHGHWGMPKDDPAYLKYKDKKWDASNQRGTQDPQIYAAMIEMIDRQVGEIRDLLKKLEIEKDTIIFLCGDNGGQPYFKNAKHPHGFLAPNLNPKTGERFRGGKGNFYEGGLRIPFITNWPGTIKPGRVTDHLGYFPDIMPTLAELAGTTAREDTDGLSIVPTLLGKGEQKQHDYLYWEDRQSIAIRQGTWKAISPKKGKPFELYDLSKDLEEKKNIAKKHPELLAKLIALTKEAHTAPKLGKVLDPTAGYKRSQKH